MVTSTSADKLFLPRAIFVKTFFSFSFNVDCCLVSLNKAGFAISSPQTLPNALQKRRTGNCFRNNYSNTFVCTLIDLFYFVTINALSFFGWYCPLDHLSVHEIIEPNITGIAQYQSRPQLQLQWIYTLLFITYYSILALAYNSDIHQE